MSSTRPPIRNMRYFLSLAMLLGCTLGANTSAQSQSLRDVPQGQVIIESAVTERLLLSDGSTVRVRGDEGGWKASSGAQAPAVYLADDDYYNRARWVLRPTDGGYLIENVVTKRYLLSDGNPIRGRGHERGWRASSGTEAPLVYGADDNYYNRAVWKISPTQGGYLIENAETRRYLFSDGEKPLNRGNDGGWKASSGTEAPKVMATDENYYGRAVWKIRAAN